MVFGLRDWHQLILRHTVGLTFFQLKVENFHFQSIEGQKSKVILEKGPKFLLIKGEKALFFGFRLVEIWYHSPNIPYFIRSI